MNKYIRIAVLCGVLAACTLLSACGQFSGGSDQLDNVLDQALGTSASGTTVPESSTGATTEPVERYDYFVNDMIGSQVKLDDGQVVGIVDDIMQTSKKAAEIYVVKTEKGNVLFPFLKDLVLGFDKEQKILVLESKRFAEVSLYED